MLRERTCGLCHDAHSDLALLKTPNFVTMPGYGQFRDDGGYLVTVTRCHSYTSSASFSRELLTELETVMNEAAGLIQEEYGVAPIFFEHGSTCHAKAGQCVTHMHMNVIPVSVDLSKYLCGEGVHELKSLQELPLIEPPYLYIRTSDGKHIASSVATRQIPSQYLRAAIGTEMGHPERGFWDWRIRRSIDDGWQDDEAISETRRRLQAGFDDIQKHYDQSIATESQSCLSAK